MSKNVNKGPYLPLHISQNFLTSHRTIAKLLSRTTICENDYVIEIGPGKGHITSLLVKHCRKVAAIEVDPKLYAKLVDKFEALDNLHLYHQDFLKWSLPSTENYKVFANIPFCHTTSILRKLAESKNPPAEAWLTMEKGAAKRFTGQPRETLRSLMLKAVFDVTVVYHFLRDDFHPKPGVEIVLVHLKRKKQPDVLPNQLRDYERFLTTALQGNGQGLRRIFTKKQLALALREAKMQNFTCGEILYVQWLCLFRSYRKYVLGRKD